MKILNCDQGTPEWFEARLGKATASNFSRIITAKTGKLSAQVDDYIAEMIAEESGDAPPAWGGNEHTERGHELEPVARHWYEFDHDVTVDQVGMIVDDSGVIAASPDGLIGDDGGLEIKCPMGKTHVKYLIRGELPDEYKAQVHGNLLVSGREWWDFLSYHPKYKPLLLRVYADDWTQKLAAALDEFRDRLAKAKEIVL